MNNEIIAIPDLYRFKRIRIREGTARRLSRAIQKILDDELLFLDIGIPKLDIVRMIVEPKNTKFYGIRVDDVYYNYLLKLLDFMRLIPDCKHLCARKGTNRYDQHYKRIRQRALKIKQNEAVRGHLRGLMTKEQKKFLPQNPHYFGANKGLQPTNCTA